MEFILIAIIIIFVLEYTKRIDTNKFIGEAEPYFRFLMEDDYKFLLSIKYGDDIDVNKLFGNRVRNGVLTIIVLVFVFLMSNFSFINLLISVIAGYLVFKQPYSSLQKYYRNNLNKIDQMLPYYLILDSATPTGKWPSDSEMSAASRRRRSSEMRCRRSSANC